MLGFRAVRRAIALVAVRGRRLRSHGRRGARHDPVRARRPPGGRAPRGTRRELHPLEPRRGVLSKAGDTAFGAALAEAGFGGDPNTARLKAVDEKLERISASVDGLHTKVDDLTASLAFARLSAVRTSVRPLVGDITDARNRLRQLTNGSITDPTLLAEKRSELLTIIRDRLLTKQHDLEEAIYAARAKGNDDILHMSFLAQRSQGRRFWTNADGRKAYSVVGFYQDELAQLLLLRVEYVYSFVKRDSSGTYKAERRAIVQSMVNDLHAANGRVAHAGPQLVGSDNIAIDTKAGADGRHLMWISNINTVNTITPAGKVTNPSGGEQLPSPAEFRNLVAARNGQAPPAYLHAQGFTLPLVCHRHALDEIPSYERFTQETVFCTRDFQGGSR